MFFHKRFTRLLWSLACLPWAVQATPVNTMPPDFVKLSDVAPQIIQSQRYAGAENFMGRPVPGYEHTSIYCTREAALALKKVNAALNQKGYTLVVYDAYRPQRAVNAFVEWSKDKHDQVAKEKYYPALLKPELFASGYIREKSGHTRGSTIDLSLIKTGQKVKPVTIVKRQLNNGEYILFLNDNTVDMGTSFDLFHPASHPDTPLITQKQTKMRELLRKTMERYGFEGVDEEWWHFTLKHEPWPDTYFDFVPSSNTKTAG